MPVIKCSDGKFKIGSGPCIYSSKEKADKAWKGFRATVKESMNKSFFRTEALGTEKEIVLTKKELRAMLNARIRRDAGYRISSSDFGMIDIEKTARKVYDDIVASFSWNTDLVKATRSVTFNLRYVRKIVKAAEEDGTLIAESVMIDSLAEVIAEQVKAE